MWEKGVQLYTMFILYKIELIKGAYVVKHTFKYAWFQQLKFTFRSANLKNKCDISCIISKLLAERLVCVNVKIVRKSAAVI